MNGFDANHVSMTFGHEDDIVGNMLGKREAASTIRLSLAPWHLAYATDVRRRGAPSMIHSAKGFAIGVIEEVGEGLF